MELITHLLLGPLIFILALLYAKYPPKKINPYYGHRTKRSMKNEHSWKIANKYSSRLMIYLGLIIMAFQVLFALLFKFDTAVLATIGIMITGLITIVYLTEKHLKANN